MFVMDQHPNSRLQWLVKWKKGDRPEGWHGTEALKLLQFVSNVQRLFIKEIPNYTLLLLC
jgi:hypothetical protein